MDPDRPAAVISEPPPLPVPPAPVVIPPEKPAAWPSFGSDGYRVTGDAATRRVVFHYGVFSTGTTLSEAAQRDLAKIAAAFKADIRSFRIGIEGHTDATPVRSSNAFADNHELAMARANAAMEFMNEKCGIPREAMTAAASDNRNPPHPDTGRESQRKNRTVVLTITRR
jgi:outer membrane protein OmpA-like peptidoglycan-associated protein